MVLRNNLKRKAYFAVIPAEGEALIKKDEMSGWRSLPEYVGRLTGLRILCGLISINPRIFVIDDRDSYPISPFRPSRQQREKQCKTNGDTEIAARQANYQIDKYISDSKKHWYYDSMALAIMACVFLAVVLLALKLAGRI